MNFKESIQKIKSSYDIVDYIKANGVDLKSSGNGSWKGLCPFHSENTPSFTVSEDFQNFRCFGCGESGDLINFAQHIHTISVGEAIKVLAAEKGIELSGFKSEEDSRDISGIRDVVADAASFFRKNFDELNQSHAAKQEVLKRGLSLENPVYGYSLEAPNALYNYLKSKGHSDENIKESQLVMFFEDGRQPWDFFHGRLMLTMSDYLGRPVSFTSRKIFEDDKMKGKYVNGKESAVFLKKSNLYGADRAKKAARAKKKVYVVEGQFDFEILYEKGIENAVATSGTAFTSEHASLLLRMVGPSGQIVFVMDGDEAGEKSVMNIFKSFPVLHQQSLAVKLPDGQDPCDFIIENGVERFKDLVENAIPIHDFIIEAVLRDLGGKITSVNRQTFAHEVSMYAKTSNSSPIIDAMLNKASVISAYSIDNIKEIFNSIEVGKKYVRQEESIEKEKLEINISLDKNSEADKCMFTALSLLVRMPDVLLKETPEMIHKKFRGFVDEVKVNKDKYESQEIKWRFMVEDYTDNGFALLLQNKKFLENPKEDIDSSISQYKYLFSKANEIYKKEYEEIKRARALSSIANTTDPVEIANILKLYEESH